MGFFRRRRSTGVDARLRAPLRAVIAELQRAGYSVTASSLYRSPAYQEELHRRWEEGDPDIITEPAPPGQSAHNYGMAADLNLDPPDYEALGEAAEIYGLQWAGPDDPVHVEIVNWRELTRAWSSRQLVPL